MAVFEIAFDTDRKKNPSPEELADSERKLTNLYFNLSFRGKPYHFTTVGSKSAVNVLSMFGLERDIRDDWWKIQEGDFVADVGASHGSYVLPALACGAELVVAFEPNHDEIFDLLSNLYINSWLRRCIVFPVLIGSYDGMEDYDAGIHQGGVGHENTGKRSITTLDRALSGLPKLDWLKVDADGMELNVFHGAMETLTRLRPKVINENHTQLVPGVDEEMRAIMLPLGYVEENRKGENDSNENWSLWTPKEKL